MANTNNTNRKTGSKKPASKFSVKGMTGPSRSGGSMTDLQRAHKFLSQYLGQTSKGNTNMNVRGSDRGAIVQSAKAKAKGNVSKAYMSIAKGEAAKYKTAKPKRQLGR